MKFVLPRVIYGNRGDLASRWGVLNALHQLGVEQVSVFSQSAEELPPLPYRRLPYGRLRNLIPGRQGWATLKSAEVALWAVGLDFQDDSSLAKLAYLWAIFRLYRQLGLRVWILFQGAGPLTTRLGRQLAKSALQAVDLFVARDPGTYRLIGDICPAVPRRLAHDAIFLPGFEADLCRMTPAAQAWLAELLDTQGRPVIGFNLRQWFHFASSPLPYQLAQRAYLQRAQARMGELVASAVQAIRQLRQHHAARLLLISAYQPGIVSWEDDSYWLAQIQRQLADDPEVIHIQRPVSLPEYYNLMSRLNLMIGMRLHSSLIALRFGVPALNINYTLKGKDILDHLGIPENIILLEDFVKSPDTLVERATQLLQEQARERHRTQQAIQQATQFNFEVLRSLIDGGAAVRTVQIASGAGQRL